MKKKTAKKKGPMGKKCATRKMAFKVARESKEVVRKRLAKVKENDPSLPLPKFVERVNEIAERYLAPGPPRDARVTSEFSERTVRHYQAKEIIDSPEKEGKEARYRYRHILQAVLTRVMLADGFRVPFIREMLAGKTDAEYEQFLEMGPFAAKKMAREQAGGCGPEEVRSAWVRLMVAPGIELHVERGVRSPSSPEEAMELQEKLSLTLRGEFQRRRARRRRHGMEEE